MRRSQRLIAAAVVIALSGALAGCAGKMSSFDPSERPDSLGTKKKWPGERKPVFPEGVPGLEQGVPKGLYKGSAQEQIDQQNAQAAAAAAAAAPPEEPKSKQLAKSKGKSKQAATATTAPAEEPAAAPDPNAAAEAEGSTAAAPPAPKPKKIVRRPPTPPPPDQPAPSAPSAQSPQQSAAPFPAPLPSGTFTR